jgi:hypothetical protein
MKNITRTPDQIPGLVDLYAIPVTQVSSIDGFNVNLIANALIFHARWAIDTLGHTNQAERDKAGPFYNAQIRGFVYGIDYGSTELLNEMLRYKFVVVYKDSKGNYSRLGNKDIGLSFSYRESSEGRIGYDCEFSARITEVASPVHLLTGVFPAPVFTPTYDLTIQSRPERFPQYYFTGPGTYDEDTEVQVAALSPAFSPTYGNLVFDHWLEKKGSDYFEISSDNPHTITVDRNIELTAVYVSAPFSTA